MSDTSSNDVLEQKSYMISTSDNPYNPFTNFKEWFVYDESKGYHTCSLLARLYENNDELCDREDLLAYYDACEKLLRFNPYGNYIKFYESDDKVIA